MREIYISNQILTQDRKFTNLGGDATSGLATLQVISIAEFSTCC